MAYSHSKLMAYQTCPLKYRYEKIDKLDVVQEGVFENIAFVLGSSVHSALEFLYKHKRNKNTLQKDQIISYFEKVRNDEIERLDTKHEKQVFSVQERESCVERAK